MKIKVSQAWVLAIAFCFMGAAQASPVTADEEAVAQALRLMYVALTKENTAQLPQMTDSQERKVAGMNSSAAHRAVPVSIQITPK